ncbi:MAG: uridylate kinase [Candidatus Taylorbacteria bacterium]|nr:uridylate kinase [Candidatus Taylorbacteria bacterium]
MKKPVKKETKNEVIVVSVGGSLIVPEEIEINFLSALKDLIIRETKKGKRFIIITGGGKVARQYQHAANLLGSSETDADWIGIASTRLNGELVRSIFGKMAYDKVIDSVAALPTKSKQPVVIACGISPKGSSDKAAVFFAKKAKAKKIINLSNIDYVYTADPKLDPTATKIERTTWKEFRKIIPKKWTPGMSAPFDPIASKEAESIGIEVAIINGKKLGELDNYLAGKEFVGSLIK